MKFSNGFDKLLNTYSKDKKLDVRISQQKLRAWIFHWKAKTGNSGPIFMLQESLSTKLRLPSRNPASDNVYGRKECKNTRRKYLLKSKSFEGDISGTRPPNAKRRSICAPSASRNQASNDKGDINGRRRP